MAPARRLANQPIRSGHDLLPFPPGGAYGGRSKTPAGKGGRGGGRVFSSWDLSDEYGFTDIDGGKPHWGRHWEKAFGKPLMAMDEGYYAYGKDSPIQAVMPDWP